MTKRDEQGRFTAVQDEDIVDADVIEDAPGSELVPTHSAELAVIPEPSALPEILLEEALMTVDADKIERAVDVVKRLFPEMRQEAGERRRFVLHRLSDAIADQGAATEPIDMTVELDKPNEWPPAPWMDEPTLTRFRAAFDPQPEVLVETSRYPHLEALFR